MKKTLIVVGTRPEAIKLAPLILALQKDTRFTTRVCLSGQHADLISPIFDFFGITADYDLAIMRPNQQLSDITSKLLTGLMPILDDFCPDFVIVQGDTSTAFSAALAAFYRKIPVLHVEAGLRSPLPMSPFPEEMNRQVISRIVNIHLCPTEFNKKNLEKENINDKIYVIGNTGLDNIDKTGCEYGNKVLITMHRRDNHEIMDKWFEEIEKIANKYIDIEFMIPLHPNPNVQKYKYIFNKVKVKEPMSHKDLINYIKKCKFVISDSGGLQEECSYLNKKIIICRKTTERPESIDIHGFLCSNPSELECVVEKINNNFKVNSKCPYGDGKSWEKIKYIIENFL